MKLSPRALLNLGLVIAVGVLVLLVMFEPGKQADNPKTVSVLDKKTITHVLVHRDNQEDIVLEKRDNTWHMTAPYQYPANEFRVDSLLQLASTESHAQYPVEQLDVAKYGLDKPRAIVTLNHDQVFSFGNTEPIQQRRYLRYNQTMHVVMDTFYYQVAAPADGFLDHAVLPGSKSISKLVLPKLTAELKDGKWSLTPAPKDFSADQITALIDGWRYAQALQVSRYTGKPVSTAIRIYREGEDKPVEFGLSTTANEIILVRNDLKLQFVISGDKRKDLLELPPKIEANDKDTPATGKPDDHNH